MSSKWILSILVLAVAGFASWWWFAYRALPEPTPPSQSPAPIAEKPNLIRVTSPRPNATAASPLTVEGEARGFWFFEASFPVRLLDATGREIAVIPAQAQGEWMTAEFVPFRAVLTFAAPATERGTLVLEKDNPSGLPENADELRIPIRFSTVPPVEGAMREVRLYYYNPERDKDASGNILCSRAGLEAVTRSIPRALTPIQDTVRLLLKGELAAGERARGITTEYPIPGLALKTASRENGVLTLTFGDPENRTGGGACRVGVLWYQIEATAKQFSNVREVRFRPEELFQP